MTNFPIAIGSFNHYRTLLSFGSDGVLGPVIPHFEGAPPRWLIKSGLSSRKRYTSNTPIAESKNLRTGNTLLWKRVFPEGRTPFDPRYGRSGGGDAAFFLERIKEGRRFVWCDEACVYETIPPERQKLAYYMKEGFYSRDDNGMEHALLQPKHAPFVLGDTHLYPGHAVLPPDRPPCFRPLIGQGLRPSREIADLRWFEPRQGEALLIMETGDPR